MSRTRILADIDLAELRRRRQMVVRTRDGHLVLLALEPVGGIRVESDTDSRFVGGITLGTGHARRYLRGARRLP